VGVVDGDEQRPPRGEVGRHPVQPVDDGEEGVARSCARRLVAAPQQRRRRLGGPGQRVRPRLGDRALEQLAHDAEREA